MANTLDAVMPKILAQGLMALRQNCVLPRTVNRDYDSDAQKRGATIDVPVPSAIVAKDVAPSNTPPAGTDTTPTSVPVKLDKWKSADFYLTDKEKREVMEGIIPMNVSSAVKTLTETVNGEIFKTYKGVYGFAGTAGTTPFATDVSAATAVRKVLNVQQAPLRDRRLVIDPEAEAKALNLRAFQDMSFSGESYGIKEGEINRKLGFDWFMDQQVPTHQKGAAGSWLVNDSSKVAVGSTSVTVDGGTTKPVVGDIFTVAGDTQTYVVKASTNTSIEFGPKSVKEWADNAALTFKDSHTVNLAYHRDAIAFATRPLTDEDTDGLGTKIMSQVDPISGLALRLEVSRQYKQTLWSFDILFGVALVRPELIARLAG